MRVIGKGTAAAGRRRQAAVMNERRWAREREAIMVGHLQGRSVVRRGQFMVE